MLAYTFYEADNRVMRYAESLARRGDTVDVISLRRPGQASRGVLNGVNILRVQKRTRGEKARLAYLCKLILFFFRSMLLLILRQLRYKYELVHVHNIPDFMVWAAWFPKLRGAKIILDIHDVLPELYANKFGSHANGSIFHALVWVEGISARFADHVIVANHLWLDRIVQRSAPAERCSVQLNYPDAAIFYPRPRMRSDGRFILIFPGTLNSHQGLDVAIRAFARVAAKLPCSEFHIYGEGSERENLTALVRELHVEQQISLRDHVSLHQIAALMADADLAVVPKRADSFGDEAFSTKILEFMCLGVPVIVSSTQVDRHYFDDSVVRFFPSGDDAELALAIMDLASDAARRRQLAANASEFVKAFAWSRNEPLYLNLVNSLVESSPVLFKGGHHVSPEL